LCASSKDGDGFGLAPELAITLCGAGPPFKRVLWGIKQVRMDWTVLIAKSGPDVVLVQVKQVRSDKVLTNGIEEILNARDRYSSHNPTALALITNAKEVSRSQSDLARQRSVIILTGDVLGDFGGSLRAKLGG